MTDECGYCRVISTKEDCEGCKHGVSASFSNELLCCEDVGFLRKTVDSLWQIIDDIDTMSDIAKDNDKFYRSRVEKYQKRRWKLGIECDGYKLTIKAT